MKCKINLNISCCVRLQISLSQTDRQCPVELLNQSDVFQCQLHYLLLLVLISLLYLIQNCLLTGFLHLSAEEEFIEDEVGFFKIEDDVKLTDRSEIFVQHLHVSVDHLQGAQFIVRLIHGEAKEEA